MGTSEVPATPARDLTDQQQQQQQQQQLSSMKFYVALCLVTLTSASPQFGFLGNLFNGFRGNRGGGRRPASGGGGGGNCGGGHRPNHQFGGQNFLVSWRLGCSGFTQGQGENFCRANGMRPISIDNSAKESEFTRLVAREGQKYFWSHTGGAGRRQPDN